MDVKKWAGARKGSAPHDRRTESSRRASEQAWHKSTVAGIAENKPDPEDSMSVGDYHREAAEAHEHAAKLAMSGKDERAHKTQAEIHVDKADEFNRDEMGRFASK